MRDGIIIQARTGSTRLHNKILRPFYGQQRIIDILISRIRSSCPGIPVILATTRQPQDDVLEEVARQHGIFFFRGEEDNVLARFLGAAGAYGIDRLIRVCSDNPFLQTDSFNELFREHSAEPADYISYGFPDGRPVIRSHLGLFAELATTDALKRAAVCASGRPEYAEHLTTCLYTHPGQFSSRLLPLPESLRQRYDLRFTLDTHEDFSLLQELYALFVERELIGVEGLLGLVEERPGYLSGMRDNIRKNEK
ncbi:MAG: aminotransferase [Bacteroides sp.]|nr:aminotransferase [Bacteroides sp.]